MKINFANAFTIPVPPPLSAEEEAMLVLVAAKIRERRMAEPAFFALESTKPLHFLGSQALAFFMPFVEMAAGPGRAKNFAKILENRLAADRLAVLLENGGKGADNGKS